ncbi:hypothetical protein Tco_0657428 [Tanacetum coccineum]|uniref:Uncharacterized protein n=1 Tax=Tanacetum coccineum TaxID=301880 RepID=A0ABQ4XBJ0_9ASTR
MSIDTRRRTVLSRKSAERLFSLTYSTTITSLSILITSPQIPSRPLPFILTTNQWLLYVEGSLGIPSYWDIDREIALPSPVHEMRCLRSIPLQDSRRYESLGLWYYKITWDGLEDEIIFSVDDARHGPKEEARLSRCRFGLRSMVLRSVHSEGIHFKTTVMAPAVPKITELQWAADRRTEIVKEAQDSDDSKLQRQQGTAKESCRAELPEEAVAVLRLGLMIVSYKWLPRGRPTRPTRLNPGTTPPPVTDPTTTTSVTSAQLQAMIDEGCHAVLQHVLDPILAMIAIPRNRCGSIDPVVFERGWKPKFAYVTYRGESSEVCNNVSYGNSSNMVDTLHARTVTNELRMEMT